MAIIHPTPTLHTSSHALGRPFRAVRSVNSCTPLSLFIQFSPLPLHSLRAVHLGPSGVDSLHYSPNLLTFPRKLYIPRPSNLGRLVWCFLFFSLNSTFGTSRDCPPLRAVHLRPSGVETLTHLIALTNLPPPLAFTAPGRPFRAVWCGDIGNSSHPHSTTVPTFPPSRAVHLGPSRATAFVPAQTNNS